MEFSTCFLNSLLLVALLLSVANGKPVVPALIIFGDSVVDVGNNNYISTFIKANFPPYGRDFEPTHKPTGRFCNGNLVIDYAANYIGFDSYQLPFLSPEATGKNISIGANFASAGSGYHPLTAQLYRSLSLDKQLQNYKEFQEKVTDTMGKSRANCMFSHAIYLLSAGSSDFLQNYYINPLLKILTPAQFSDILIKYYSTFIQALYELGARRIGVTGLPPLGCLPAAITLFGLGSNKCVARLNTNAASFNTKLNRTSQGLQDKLPNLKVVVFDIYQPLLDLITNPAEDGFFETRKACCGTGVLETAVLCNAKSPGTCTNATGYVFWDGFHPSQAANEVLAGEILAQGISLVY